MATIGRVQDTDRVKVAVVFELDRVRPVWFEIAGQERVQVREVCAVWYHTRGSARIMSFDVWDHCEQYRLEYDTQPLSWRVGRAVIE